VPRDLVLTWPKSTKLNVYLDALAKARGMGGAINFRVASPPLLDEGECKRVYMVHDGKVRGWSPFIAVEWREFGEVEDRGGGFWPEGWYIVRGPAWHKLESEIPMRGFQGFRYIERERD
jgi:hypothetical protein